MNFLSRVVGPDSLLAGVQNVLAVRSNPLNFLSSLARQGDIVYRRLGPYPAYLLNTPELVRELLVNHARTSTKGPLVQRSKQLFGQGLLTSEGEHHLRQRRLMQATSGRAAAQHFWARRPAVAAAVRPRP